MADLYIANCSKHHQTPTVKLGRLESDRLKIDRPDNYSMPIPPGQQVLFFSGAQGHINAILRQLLPYGYVLASEVPLTRGFVGMVFSDKPINVDSFMVADEQNHGVLLKKGADNRIHTANMVRSISEQAARQVGAEVTDFQLTLRQEQAKVSPKGETIHETIRFQGRAA